MVVGRSGNIPHLTHISGPLLTLLVVGISPVELSRVESGLYSHNKQTTQKEGTRVERSTFSLPLARVLFFCEQTQRDTHVTCRPLAFLVVGISLVPEILGDKLRLRVKRGGTRPHRPCLSRWRTAKNPPVKSFPSPSFVRIS